MAHRYSVKTPLEEQGASTAEDVRAIIDRYMESSPEATLNAVIVMEIPEPTGQPQTGTARSPADFWPTPPSPLLAFDPSP
jgi:hypothetical protein